MKVFLVLWGDPKFYQTLIFLAQYLSKKGLKIFIISKNTKKDKNIIKKVDFGKNTKIIQSPKLFSGYSNIIDYVFFLFFLLFKYLSIKPKDIIFFNKKALFSSLILTCFKNIDSKFIYHNFDFELVQNVNNFKESFLISTEFICSKLCDYLIFPSLERSKLFKKNSKNNSSKIFYLMNCFPKDNKIKFSSSFKKFLNKKKLNKKKIICHLGSIGPDHYLEEIVESIRFVKNDVILIIAGISIADFSIKLNNIISKFNLEQKVFIFEDIDNEYWFEILKKSNLGLCFYKASGLSHQYMAGTSQKFNNYLYFKIPMIVNDNLDFRKFKKKYDIYDITNPDNPKNVAKNIDRILINKKRYSKIKKNMLSAFNNELNFEFQYSKSYGKFL